jgi:hypothetical protein
MRDERIACAASPERSMIVQGIVQLKMIDRAAYDRYTARLLEAF